MDDSERLKANASVVEAIFHASRSRRKRRVIAGQERLTAAYLERVREIARIEALAREWDSGIE